MDCHLPSTYRSRSRPRSIGLSRSKPAQPEPTRPRPRSRSTGHGSKGSVPCQMARDTKVLTSPNISKSRFKTSYKIDLLKDKGQTGNIGLKSAQTPKFGHNVNTCLALGSRLSKQDPDKHVYKNVVKTPLSVNNSTSSRSCYRPSISKPMKATDSKGNTKQCKGILKKVMDYPEKTEVQAISKHVQFKKPQEGHQASLRSKLNEWLVAKGKTPSGCRHLMCFDAQMSAAKKKLKPVPGRLSVVVLGKQEITMREEANSRKRLFDGESNPKPSKSPALKKSPSSFKRKSCTETGKQILTPLDLSNKINVKSSRKSFPSASEKNICIESHCASVSSKIPDVHEKTHPIALEADPHQPEVLPSKSVTECDKEILDNLNSMLLECLHLYKCFGDALTKLKSYLKPRDSNGSGSVNQINQNGCPVQNIVPWFEEIDANIPQAKTFAPYYVCKAQVFSGNPQQALDVLCQAVENNAQPSDILASTMRDLFSPYCVPRHHTLSTSPASDQMTPTTLQSSSDSLEQMGSLTVPVTGQTLGVSQLQHLNQEAADNDLGSTIKYCVSFIPGNLRLKQTPDSVPLAKVTPIRRSLRFSNRQQTPYRKELDSVSDLTLKEAKTTMYQDNLAILD